jgi:hypothetical protein
MDCPERFVDFQFSERYHSSSSGRSGEVRGVKLIPTGYRVARSME